MTDVGGDGRAENGSVTNNNNTTDAVGRTNQRRVTIDDSALLLNDDAPLQRRINRRRNNHQVRLENTGSSTHRKRGSRSKSQSSTPSTYPLKQHEEEGGDPIDCDDDEGAIPILDGSLRNNGSGEGKDGNFTFALVHDYKPTPTLPLNEKQLKQHWFTASYINPALENEFLRFNYRDLMGMAISIGFGIGTLSFVVFFASITTWIGAGYVLSGTVQLLCGVILGILHFFYASCSDRVSVMKMVLVTTDAVVACFTLATLPEQFAKDCEEGGAAGGRERDDCTDRVNSALLVALCGVTVLLRIRSFHAMLITTTTILLKVLSHFILFNSAQHLSDRKSAVRSLIATGGAITAAVMCICRDRMVRSQFNQTIRTLIESRELEQEKKVTDTLLSSLLPRAVIHRIVFNNERVEDTDVHGTIFFSDIAGFTKWSDSRTPYQVVEMVSVLCVKFDAAAEIHQVDKVKTIGDAYWAVSGLPTHWEEHSKTIIEFAIHCLQIVDVSNRQNPSWDNIEIRIGVHTGSISGGVLGSQQLSYEIFGEANDVANLVEQNGLPMEVVCTGETKQACTLNDVLFIPHLEITHQEQNYATYVVRVKAEVINHLKEERRRKKLAELRDLEKKEEQARVPSVSPIALEPDNPVDRNQLVEESSAVVANSFSHQPLTPQKLVDSQRTEASDDSFRAESSTNTNDTATRFMPPLSAEDRLLSRAFLVTNKQRTVQNSKISLTTGKSLDELRVESQKFLRKRRKRTQEVEDDELQTLEDELKVETEVSKYLRPKYKYCLYTYASAAAEEEYRVFLLKHMRNLRLGSSATMTSTAVLILLSSFIDSKENGGVGLIPSIVLAVAIIFGCVSCGSAWGLISHKADPVVMGICVLACLVSLKLIEQPNTAANDPLWLHVVTFVTYGHNLAWLPFPVLYASLFLFVAAPSIALTVGTPYINTGAWNVLMLMGAIWPIAAIFERYFRKQFFDFKIFNGQKELKLEQHGEYIELLGQAVPEHIAPDLQHWFASGMHIERPIMISYNTLVVGFLRFDPPEGRDQPLPIPESRIRTPKGREPRGGESSLGQESDPTSEESGHTPKGAAGGSDGAGVKSSSSPRALYHTRDSVTTDMLRGSTSGTHGTETYGSAFPVLRADDSDGLLTLGAPTTTTTTTAGGPRVEDGQERHRQEQSRLTWDFMCAIQNAIEESMTTLGLKHIVKIKTVGNTTLLAGPIQPTRDPAILQLAAAELVALALALRGVDVLGYIKCGLHAGPAQGVVLGIDRMAFDILGSTVNKASRVMNAKDAQPADILATREFAKFYNQWKETRQMGASNSMSDHGAPPSTAVLLPPPGAATVSPFFPAALPGSSREASSSLEGTPLHHLSGTGPRQLPSSSGSTAVGTSGVQVLSLPTSAVRSAPIGPLAVEMSSVEGGTSSMRSENSNSMGDTSGPDIIVQQPSQSQVAPPPQSAGIRSSNVSQHYGGGQGNSSSIIQAPPPNLLIPVDGEETSSVSGTLSRAGSSLSNIPQSTNLQLKAAEFTEAFQAEFKGFRRSVQLFRLRNVFDSAQEIRSRRGSSVVQPSLRSLNSFVSGTQSIPQQPNPFALNNTKS